jgi:predicted nucleotidyltransferase
MPEMITMPRLSDTMSEGKTATNIEIPQENIIQQNLLQIQNLMRKYGVQKAYAFGSAIKETMNENSDIDFIIKFPDDMDYVTYADNYFALAHSLEDLLERKVDLVSEKTLHNPYLIENINNHKVQVL